MARAPRNSDLIVLEYYLRVAHNMEVLSVSGIYVSAI